MSIQVSPAAPVGALSATDYQKLIPWFAALANRKAKRANVVMLGDSLVEGHPLTSYARTWPQTLQQILRARFPTPGVTGGRGYVGMPSSTARGDAGLYPIAFTGGAFDGGAVFGGTGAKKNLWYANAGSTKIIFTVDGPLTSFDILHTKSTAGGGSTGYYKIDAAANVPFACSAGANTPFLLHVASAVTSTLEIGWNAAGFVAVDGIIEYKGDESAGIAVHNCGESGTYASFWNTAPAGWPGAVKLLTPDLVVLTLGTNDSTTSVGNRTSTQFKTDMTTLIASLRTATVTCPIVLAAAWDSTLVRVEPWQNYVNKMKEIASADSTVVVADLSARMPAGGSASAIALGLYSDAVHSNANGNAYGYAADALASIIAPR